MRYTAIARAAYGLFLLLTPGAAVRLASGESADRVSATVGRVLGLRHLAQALVIDLAGTRGWLLRGVAIDATHALSMVGIAALNRSYRRSAAFDAALATGLTINGLRRARNAP
jgi:hypothetical protein